MFSTLNSIKQITTNCEGSKQGNISHNATPVLYVVLKLKSKTFLIENVFVTKKDQMSLRAML